MPARSVPAAAPRSYLKLAGRLPKDFDHPAILRGPGDDRPLGLFWFFSTPEERREVSAAAGLVALKITAQTREPLVASIWDPKVRSPQTVWIGRPHDLRDVA